MTGVVLAFVGIVIPIMFVVAQFGKMETADSLGVPLGRGTASIDMTAGHAYDLLTERRGRLNTCVLDGPETTETVSVRARSSRIEYSVGDRQDPGDDVARGVGYVAGSFESPMSGNVTVMCEGDAAAGSLTLTPTTTRVTGRCRASAPKTVPTMERVIRGGEKSSKKQ